MSPRRQIRMTLRRSRLSVAFLLGSILCPSLGLSGQESARQDLLDRILDEGMQRSRAPELYSYLNTVIGPRLTGTPAFKRAADWAVETLETWGMAQARLEAWEFGRGWTLEGFSLELESPRYFPLTGYPEAWTPSTRGPVEGTPVYVGDKTMEELEEIRASLEGTIVLIAPPQTRFITEDRLQPAATNEPVPIGAPGSYRSRGPVNSRQLETFLQEAGAAMVLEPNQGQHGTIFVLGNRNTPNDALPTVVMASEHYNLLVRLLQAGEEVTVRGEVRVRYHEEDTNGYNVLAEIPGTDPEVAHEVVLLGGHLDSWHSATGGSDNADGVAASMEAMRILKTVGVRPRRTIQVALWGGEEEGLLGSREWVTRHTEGDPGSPNPEELYVYFNNDPGYGKILGWYLEENDAIKPIFDAWLEPLKEVGALRNVREGMGSTDHVPFVRAGLQGYNAIQDYRDYDTRTHHTNMDFFERVPEEDLIQSAVVLAAFAYQAAMHDGPLPEIPRPGGE